MRPRQSLTEIFSTFLQFDADRFGGWATEPKLRRSMQRCLTRLEESEPETSAVTVRTENFWVLYWYKIWQTQPVGLAREHLSAYLQEVCYWSAQKATASFASVQNSLSDCFQMAIARFDKVLKGFNPKQGFGLKSYAGVTFGSLIKDILRQRQEVDLCTNWALLRKLSQKRLVEALQHEGLTSEAIASYVLVWNCFRTAYVPIQATGTRKLPPPDRATWDAITHLYNTERHSQLYPPGPACSPEVLEKRLVACAKAARSYLYPTLTSINKPKPGSESGEVLDDLVGKESLLSEMITQEEEQTRQTQQTQLNDVLAAALAQLDAQSQKLLQLYYAQQLTQQQIAAELEMKQYTVSRRLTKAREVLLITLAQWSQKALHISLSSDLLKYTSAILDEWLASHYDRSSQLAEME